MEIVNDSELCRYAIIDFMDVIFYDSDDLNFITYMYDTLEHEKIFKGIYDYKENKYIKENKNDFQDRNKKSNVCRSD